MDLQRMLRDMRELGRAMADPDIAPPDDEADGYELTVSARDFTKSTRKVLDEKLTFSAALMRAGEVHEAKRILAEVEHDVRSEEAALLEKVNEVSAKRAVKRAHMTRMRLVRMLATAMVGAGLLGVSAMGMAVAGMFDERSPRRGQQARRPAQFADARGAQAQKKKVMLGDVALKLTKKDIKTLRRLTSGSVNAAVLERFLETDLDLPRSVVDEAIASVLALADPVVAEVEAAVEATAPAVDAVAVVETAKKKAAKDAEQSAEEPAEEPAEESEGPTEPTPADDDGGNDEGSDGGDGDGDGGKGGGDGDGDGNALTNIDRL